MTNSAKNFIFDNLLEIKDNELTDFLNSNSELEFPKHDSPLFSIIIPTFNKAHLTLACLKSIHQNTQLKYEVIIIDNNSNDLTHKLLDQVKNIKTIKNSQNLFFSKASNQGATASSAEYLLFLNNDIQVLPDYDIELFETYNYQPNAGAIGGQLIYPNGELQEAGCMIWSDGTPWAYGRNGNPFHWEHSFTRKVDYCSAALLLMKKKLFTELGGFSERYSPCYFEDTDLQMKIKENGKDVIFNPFVKAIHHEHGSISSKNAMLLIKSNKKKFAARWKHQLQKHFPSSTSYYIARQVKPIDKVNILIVDNRVPIPEHGGGYPRAYKFINHLQSLGHNITLFPLKKDEVDTDPWLERTNELQKKGIEVIQGPISFQRFAEMRSSTYDLVIVSRGGALKKVVSHILKIMPTSKLIFDSEAMDYLRNVEKYKFKKIKFCPNESKQELQNELFLYNIADSSIFINKREYDFVTDIEPSIKEKSIILGHPIDPSPTPRKFKQREGFAFIGGFIGNSGLNEDAVSYFVKNSWSKIHQSTSTHFNIYGSNMPKEVYDLSKHNGVEPLGFAESLFELYNNHRVLIISHQYCGGIPWKLSEAMAYGIPIVISSIIAEQMRIKEGQGVLIAKSSDEFIEKSIKLYQSQSIWEDVREKGLRFIKETHSSEKWQNDINTFIEDIVQKDK